MRIRAKSIANFLAACACVLFVSTAVVYADIHTRYDKRGRVHWHGPIDKKEVALTFDDGPSEETLKILDVLKEYDVKATFFVVGKNVKRYPGIFKRMVREGHVIGNHSYSHPFMFLKSAGTLRKEIVDTEDIVRKYYGKKMFLLRTPYGVENSALFNEAKKCGYIIIKWSVSGNDWSTNRVDKIVKRIINNIRNGSIITLHDAVRLMKKPICQPTIEALPGIISALKAKGYRFVTVPELLGIKEDQYENISAKIKSGRAEEEGRV